MINTILFPTDFSKGADVALLYALQFARSLNARIVTMHAYHLPDVRNMNLPNTMREVYDSIQLEHFENYRDHVPHLRELAEEHGHGDIEMQHMMVESSRGVVATIISTAQKEDASMIIMGTTGAGALKELFLGSVAGETLENASCPVMVVPPEANYDKGIHHILMPTEFAESEIPAVQSVLTLAEMFKARVTCLHIDTSHTTKYVKRKEAFQEQFKEGPQLQFKVQEHFYPESAIAHYVESQGVDLIVMLTHKRSFLQEMFTYSMTKKMSYSTEVPVLALHASDL